MRMTGVSGEDSMLLVICIETKKSAHVGRFGYLGCNVKGVKKEEEKI